jgi:hypothetical protein
LCVLQPLVEVTYVVAHDQTAKALEQLVSGVEAFIVVQDVLERLTLVLIELVRRT